MGVHRGAPESPSYEANQGQCGGDDGQTDLTHLAADCGVSDAVASSNVSQRIPCITPTSEEYERKAAECRAWRES